MASDALLLKPLGHLRQELPLYLGRRQPLIRKVHEDVEYAELKAACERVLQEILPGAHASVRAGLIVGPHDATGRFTYWPLRFAAGVVFVTVVAETLLTDWRLDALVAAGVLQVE